LDGGEGAAYGAVVMGLELDYSMIAENRCKCNYVIILSHVACLPERR